MQHFVGTYECKADDKGRIMLPMSLKKQLSDKLKNGFVIKRAVFNPVSYTHLTLPTILLV